MISSFEYLRKLAQINVCTVISQRHFRIVSSHSFVVDRGGGALHFCSAGISFDCVRCKTKVSLIFCVLACNKEELSSVNKL
jgi:hypothetical protein